MTSEARLIKVGPPDRKSCRYPRYFDLKGHNEISHIFISAGDQDGIASIQFQYVENGKYVLSDQFGASYGKNQFYTIDLNHPAEYITGVSGLHCDFSSDLVQAITFTTNVKNYGPFGVTDPNTLCGYGGTPKSFSYNLGKSCKFGGFHGIYNSYGLHSIGFYLCTVPVPPNSASKIPKKEA